MEKTEQLTNQNSNAALENREDTAMKIWEMEAAVLRYQLSQSLLNDVSDAISKCRNTSVAEIHRLAKIDVSDKLIGAIKLEVNKYMDWLDELIQGVVDCTKKFAKNE